MAGALVEDVRMAVVDQASEVNPGPMTNPRQGDRTLACADGDGLCIESLESGTTLHVQTVNSLYRIAIVDGPRHEVTMCGGTAFPEAELLRIAGATDREGILRPGWIVVGRPMELLLGPLRIRSSVVRSIAIASTR
jgi:hypothetical protein